MQARVWAGFTLHFQPVAFADGVLAQPSEAAKAGTTACTKLACQADCRMRADRAVPVQHLCRRPAVWSFSMPPHAPRLSLTTAQHAYACLRTTA